MAHFGEVPHTASDSLATSGMRHDLGEIPAPSAQTKNANLRLLPQRNSQIDVRNPAKGSTSDVKIDYFRKKKN